MYKKCVWVLTYMYVNTKYMYVKFSGQMMRIGVIMKGKVDVFRAE